MAALEGLRILDLSRLLPGPYCTLLLADLGADVIKLEDPAGGDPLRELLADGERAPAFEALNRNKRSLALDLRAPAGIDAVRRLVGRFDVVVESFRPGVLARLGIGFEALSRVNPRVVVCALSGYGASGQGSQRAGHDLNYLARSGLLGAGGDAGASPAMPGGQFADIGGAFTAAVGILAAVLERQRTGRGRFLDVSLCEASLAFFHLGLGAALASGEPGAIPARGAGPLNGGFPCYGIYATRDGRHLALAALEPKFWGAFCTAVGREDLLPLGWSGGEEGARARAELTRLFGARTLDEWRGFLADHDVCCEPVREGDELLEAPVEREGGVFAESVDAGGRKVRHLRTPVRLPAPSPQRAPRLGEHSADVLAEAGFSSEEIARLRAERVIAG